MVKIYVGLEKKRWVFKEDIVCDHYEHFRAASKNEFNEGREKTLYLPEDDPAIFCTLCGLGGNERAEMYTSTPARRRYARQMPRRMVHTLGLSG